MSNQRIALIGGGHITEIILTNLMHGRYVPPEHVIVSSRGSARLAHLRERFGVRTAATNAEAARKADLIFVNVRPEVVPSVVTDLRAAGLRADQVVISLAGGVPLSRYSALGAEQPLVRALPNPPSEIGQGVAALSFALTVTPAQREAVRALFAVLGVVVEVEERHLNVITALSSPVATLLFFESLVAAGVRLGLPRATATQVAAQTIEGTLALWRASGKPPHELMAIASTPGGISVESLYTLEQRAFKAALMEAIERGAARADALGRGG